MAIKKDPHGRGHSVGNLDDDKRGRHLGGRQSDGVKGTNPVTVEQVKSRRGLKGRKDGK
jgi:hypothetical protein